MVLPTIQNSWRLHHHEKPLLDSCVQEGIYIYIYIYTFFLFLFGAWDSDVLLILQTGVNWVPNKNAALIVDFEAIDSRRADRRCSKWSNVSKSFKSDGYRWEWLDPVVWYDRSWDFFRIKTLFVYVFVGGVRFLLMSFWETVLPSYWFAILNSCLAWIHIKGRCPVLFFFVFKCAPDMYGNQHVCRYAL